jgi:hypothetical protein
VKVRETISGGGSIKVDLPHSNCEACQRFAVNEVKSVLARTLLHICEARTSAKKPLEGLQTSF